MGWSCREHLLVLVIDTVVLATAGSATAYPDALRRVSYFDALTGKRLEFPTNNFTPGASTDERGREPELASAAASGQRAGRVYRTQSGLAMPLLSKRIAALRAKLHAGQILLNLRGHDLLPQACKQRFALCNSQSHGSRRDFLCPLDDPYLVPDGAVSDRLKYQLECPFHHKRLTHPTALHTLQITRLGIFRI